MSTGDTKPKYFAGYVDVTDEAIAEEDRRLKREAEAHEIVVRLKAAGAADERAAIVVRLRTRATSIRNRAAECSGITWDAMLLVAVTLEDEADRIERGEHHRRENGGPDRG